MRVHVQVTNASLTLVRSGVLLASLSLKNPDVWDLSMLFSLQTVTPIHIAPAMWLGLHWKGLRAEAVLAGMVVGELDA
jgi:Na+/proline symporter